jgi:hypothetical protein
MTLLPSNTLSVKVSIIPVPYCFDKKLTIVFNKEKYTFNYFENGGGEWDGSELEKYCLILSVLLETTTIHFDSPEWSKLINVQSNSNDEEWLYIRIDEKNILTINSQKHLFSYHLPETVFFENQVDQTATLEYGLKKVKEFLKIVD